MMIEQTEVLVKKYSENGITTLTLNQPERRNSLSMTMLEALSAELESVADDVDTDFIVLENPLPGVASPDPCPGRVGTDDAALPQAGQDRRELGVKAGLDPLEQVGQGRLTDLQRVQIGEQFRQTLVTDRVFITHVNRRCLDGRRERRPRLKPRRNRRHEVLRAMGAGRRVQLHPGDDGSAARQFDLVIDRMQLVIVVAER